MKLQKCDAIIEINKLLIVEHSFLVLNIISISIPHSFSNTS